MNDIIRLILPDSGQHKGSSNCTYPSCGRTTREAKPFCSDHIDESPYVRQVMAELTRRGAEEEILERDRGRIPTDGFFYRETLLLLRGRDYTVKGLARKLDLSHKAAARLIVLVAGDSLATKSTTSRGDLTISGLGAHDPTHVDD